MGASRVGFAIECAGQKQGRNTATLYCTTLDIIKEGDKVISPPVAQSL